MAKARQGQFFCLDAGTGETLWTSPGREGDNAALIDAGPVLMLLTTDAELKIIDKSAAGLEQLAQYRVADTPTWAHPAVAGIGGDMGIVIKDASALTVWSTPGREGADK
jgi:outer membrane protein assembly factor BamB